MKVQTGEDIQVARKLFTITMVGAVIFIALAVIMPNIG